MFKIKKKKAKLVTGSNDVLQQLTAIVFPKNIISSLVSAKPILNVEKSRFEFNARIKLPLGETLNSARTYWLEYRKQNLSKHDKLFNCTKKFKFLSYKNIPNVIFTRETREQVYYTAEGTDTERTKPGWKLLAALIWSAILKVRTRTLQRTCGYQ